MNGQLGLDASIAVVSPLSVFQGESSQVMMLGDDLKNARLTSTVIELWCVKWKQEQR
jgi:hypothetical protein